MLVLPASSSARSDFDRRYWNEVKAIMGPRPWALKRNYEPLQFRFPGLATQLRGQLHLARIPALQWLTVNGWKTDKRMSRGVNPFVRFAARCSSDLAPSARQSVDSIPANGAPTC
jgi:hypothetical protein